MTENIPITETPQMLCVKTDKGCFISDCLSVNDYNYNYYRMAIKDLIFNGKRATEIYCKNWYYMRGDNLGELIGVRLPKQLAIKGVITVNNKDYFGKVTPYAMRLDKNGYPHFLFCLSDNWVWLSAKHFTTEW